MSRSALHSILLVLLLGAAACSRESPDSMGPEGLSLARTVSAGIEIRNPTARPIYYLALEREFAARALFAPCADPERCPSVAPGSTRTIPLSEVAGYHDGARAVIVYYWHLTARDGTHVVESLNSMVLPIRS